MRLTKQQIAHQTQILNEYDLATHFNIGKDLIWHMAAEIKLCHEQISKRGETVNTLLAELQKTSVALEAERNISRWEHFKRAIWIHRS